jgi:hypothetical protein
VLEKNQGEDHFVVFTEAWLSMVQLYYQKEQYVVMQLNASHVSMREQKKFKSVKSKEEEEN